MIAHITPEDNAGFLKRGWKAPEGWMGAKQTLATCQNIGVKCGVYCRKKERGYTVSPCA